MDSSVQESVVKGTLWKEGGGGGKRGKEVGKRRRTWCLGRGNRLLGIHEESSLP